jgi:N-acetylglucosaminyl-diphospho-decaprenol L-rhamnosyltransferase
MPPIDVSILVVSYNTRDLLSACLRTLSEAVAPFSHEVIVADNASSDGSVAMLRREWPNVSVIEMGANTGFARATNRAMAASSGRYVLLLNSDTEASPGSIGKLIAFLDGSPAAAVAAPQLLNSDLTDQGTARAFPTASAFLFGRKALLTKLFPRNPWTRRYMVGRERRDGQPFRIDWVSGACLLARRSAVNRVGMLDEGFFMHWEDADWCHRMIDAGYDVYCVPSARVVHHEGQSERRFGGVERRERVGRPAQLVWVFHESAYRYVTKHIAPQPWHPLRPIAAAGLRGRALAIIAANAVATKRASRARPGGSPVLETSR